MLRLPTEISLDIAKRERVLRRKKRISQQTLSEKSGVSLGSIKRFETTGKISLESLLQIAWILERLPDFDSVFEYNQIPEHIDDIFR
ncbi:MAG: helix-turn-helix domain-containing protein [Bacteroidetes bacterium]|nr:helix-turn-helix domain-containing protein [Bacteroidota bacterium]MBU1720481.1 helix-turn-helix domain-containing protein [Bacteroidota bacterium]